MTPVVTLTECGTTSLGGVVVLPGSVILLGPWMPMELDDGGSIVSDGFAECATTPVALSDISTAPVAFAEQSAPPVTVTEQGI